MEMPRNLATDLFAGFALGILVEYLSRKRSQHGEDARRASANVLVEVEAQAFAPSQRRVIFLQILHDCAGFQHVFPQGLKCVREN